MCEHSPRVDPQPLCSTHTWNTYTYMYCAIIFIHWTFNSVCLVGRVTAIFRSKEKLAQWSVSNKQIVPTCWWYLKINIWYFEIILFGGNKSSLFDDNVRICEFSVLNVKKLPLYNLLHVLKRNTKTFLIVSLFINFDNMVIINLRKRKS